MAPNAAVTLTAGIPKADSANRRARSSGFDSRCAAMTDAMTTRKNTDSSVDVRSTPIEYIARMTMCDVKKYSTPIPASSTVGRTNSAEPPSVSALPFSMTPLPWTRCHGASINDGAAKE
ncbi:MAG: hypothetical protein ACLTEX_01370 [Eggerthella lenta]